MAEESKERQLREDMQKARREYLRLNDQYDEFLKVAHQSEHGTPAVIEALQNANAIGPDFTRAMEDYQHAVERLAEFYVSRAKEGPSKS